jgi:hypothetical protein
MTSFVINLPTRRAPSPRLLPFSSFSPPPAFLLQDFAYEPSQKYKEGKYILERSRLVDVQ